jgi:hypothetical protein
MHNDDFVKGIKLGTVDGVVQPEDILTETEISAMRTVAKGNIRNEALFETIKTMRRE